MALLHLEPLPPRTTRRDVLHLVTTTGGLDRARVGRIELRGKTAVIEVPEGWPARLVKALDGAAWQGRHVRAWAEVVPGTGSEEDHFQRLARLLDLESRAEAEQALAGMHNLTAAAAERTGNTLVDLTLVEEYPGLGGRWIVTLARRGRSPLPWTRLGTGAPVLLSVQGAGAESGRRGVVCERDEQTLRVALNEPPEDGEAGSYRVDLSADEAARLRQRAALERARSAKGDRLAGLRDLLLGEGEPAFDALSAWEPLDAALDESQCDAVGFALAAHDVAVIHGPPGTGKTTAVVELIRQAVRRGDKVLACAPSNLAVDNLLERLLARGERAVRLGHPARVLPGLREHTLDLMVEDHNDRRLARKLAKNAYALFRKAGKFTRARPEPGARSGMRQEARALLADARRLEAQAVESILNGATVLCATLTGLDSEVLGQRRFDLAVIDEACQSTEPACWLPLARCRRLVLAGDPCQLPPTVVSPAAAAEGFAVSLLERLVTLHGEAVTRRLRVQYRMHEAIMDFSSRQFYSGELEAHASVAARRLCDLPGVAADALTEAPVQFLDTAGAGHDEEVEPDGASRLNRGEAQLVARKVRALLATGVRPEDMAIIAPYAAQVRLLREELAVPGLEIDSVDGFQGREKEAIVVTLVRSNTEGEIGFLADVRRMNVAWTRARRKLLVVGDSATLAIHPFFGDMLAYFEEVGGYTTVWEEPE